jgi:hypothetical protein
MTDKPFGVVKESHARSIAFGRFDLAQFLEREPPVPVSVMHRSFQSLKKTSELTNLKVEKIEGISESDAVRVHGRYCRNPALYVDAVWVNAASKRYRAALEERAIAANLLDAKMDGKLHADHVVNRASLKEMIGKHQPWVMMFAVPASANTNFGVNVERQLKPFGEDTGQLFMDESHIFKLFMTDWPRNAAEFNLALEQIQGQIRSEKWVNAIRARFGPLFT